MSSSSEITSGIITGITSSIIFNPIDKIIFTCCLKNQSIFDKSIWCNLYKGSFNTIITRIITSGLYFSYLDHYSATTDNKFEVAAITALVCSITSPIQLIKFHSWHSQISSNQSIRIIYSNKGLIGFGRGIFPLIIRDFIFNSIYLNFKKKNEHAYNLAVITGSIIIASPFNLFKNKMYATDETLKEIIRNFKFKQLGLGMSIFRNCLSFYASQLIYDNCKKFM